ncbi:conserved Plasmodium protein, unknown function [Plasmodium relictum]|uniref:Uncharacterized protein n=1 Tax=Plasmodium relictum TaxID=85471 RepID=A0A1J1HB31_PLARL|nr:conserved Plasmodium protein, unknown function [Plasmodium relictum]CRH02636.1 conserved Plasmodium protein, unknown function [Plasmodium relictum]
MACINQGKPLSPRVKFKTIQKIKEQEYITEQAYLIPENDGTAIYLSYELNKSLENIFKRYSINGYMGVNEFIKMCYDCNLLPKNKNKDILHYIFKPSNSLKIGYIEYKDFFQILHRLSEYLFRKLIMTEQEKFNVLIKHLTTLKFSKEELNHEKYNVGIQVSVEKQSIGVNAVCDMMNSSCNTFNDIKNQETMTDIIEITSNQKNKDKKKSDELIIENNINCSKLKSRSSEEFEIKERIQEIEKKCIYKEEINKKLKEEINNALKIIEEKNIEIEDINTNNLKQLEIEREKITELKNEIKKLQQEKTNLEEKQKKIISNFENKERFQLNKTEELKKTEMDYLELKRLLFLPSEEEAMLIKVFSLYSSYNGEIVENVMNKKHCANFLANYYLLRKNEKNENETNLSIEDAEDLFNEVLNKRKYIENKDLNDVFTYFYFKLLLCNVGKFLYPELTERESFLEIVLNHVLLLNKNEDFINKEEQNKKIKKKNKIKIKSSNELEVFKEGIIGGYTSSDKSVNFNDFKKNKEKKRLETHKKRLILQKMKAESDYTDQSFEYIESDETKKKKKKNKVKNKKGKIKAITNYLKQNVEYKGTYGYDTCSEECNSIISINSDYLHSDFQKNNIIQPLKIQDTFMKIPKKVHKGTKITKTKNITNFQNKLPLYDIEGKIWPSKSEKRNFIPVFGNE